MSFSPVFSRISSPVTPTSHRLLVASGRRLHKLKGERLLVQNRWTILSIFPRRDVGKSLIVALWLAIRSLILFPKMRPARFLPIQSVVAEQLAKLKEIRNPARILQLLIERFPRPGDCHTTPKL